MFSLSTEPIDAHALTARLNDDRAGALVTFDGRVRNHNEGRPVIALEYEAYGALATKEGLRILEEARQRFGLYDCLCVHRTGKLAIGEVAVWVGVLAAHRGEAFAACRYIIDEVKQRVPIWKKEHYVSGDTGWVNCVGDGKTPALPCEETPAVACTHAPAHAGCNPAAARDPHYELDILELSSSDLSKFEIVDIREADEDNLRLLKSLLMREITYLPASKIAVDNPPFDKRKKYLLVSQRGQRSAKLAAELRSRGWDNIYSLVQGVEAVRRKYIA